MEATEFRRIVSPGGRRRCAMTDHSKAELDWLCEAARRALKPDLAADIWGLKRIDALPVDLIQQLDEAGYAVWCVAFSNRGHVADARAWLEWLHPDFRHVFAFRQLTEETTLVVNQVGSALACAVCPLPLEHYLRATLESGRLVLATVRPIPPLEPFLRGPMTCVECVKSLLGIRAWRLLTPRHLWRRLCADGAVQIML